MSITIKNLSNKKDNRKYTFSDIHFDFSERKISNNSRNDDVVAGNDIDIDVDEVAIMNSIRNIITQRRYLNPSFGINIKKYIGGSITELTSKTIGDEIDRGINLFEPRVKVDKIIVMANPDNYAYYIMIALSLPNLNKNFLFNGVLDNTGNFNFINR